jgi:8-oxo-dGTP diphosphatase
MDDAEPVLRPTARLIVLDAADRVLLFKIEDDTVVDPLDPEGTRRRGGYWITPGGAVEPGESFAAAALREMAEETGLDCTLGSCVLEREKLLLVHGKGFLLQEQYFLARVEDSDVSLDGLTELEQTVYRDHRWWTVADLAATTETVFPEELAAVVTSVLKR